QCAEPAQHVRRRGAEGERHQLGPEVGQPPELLPPAVVVAELRVADLDVVVLSQLVESFRVIVELMHVGDAGLRHEKVDTYRAGGRGARRQDVTGQPVWADIATGQ